MPIRRATAEDVMMWPKLEPTGAVRRMPLPGSLVSATVVSLPPDVDGSFSLATDGDPLMVTMRGDLVFQFDGVGALVNVVPLAIWQQYYLLVGVGHKAPGGGAVWTWHRPMNSLRPTGTHVWMGRLNGPTSPESVYVIPAYSRVGVLSPDGLLYVPERDDDPWLCCRESVNASSQHPPQELAALGDEERDELYHNAALEALAGLR